MSDRIIHLNLPERVPARDVPAAPTIFAGRRYQLLTDKPSDDPHGMCGGVDYCTHYGRVLTVSAGDCYFWDADVELTSEDVRLHSTEGETITLTSASHLITSQFVMSHSTLDEPQITDQHSAPVLHTTAGFHFVFNTSLPAVCLGVVNLVETRRFALLSNGESHNLLDTGEGKPVLYLGGAAASGEVFTPILETRAGTDSIQHRYGITLTQTIYDTLAGSEVESLTVLEHYTTFFMQRELPFGSENIWTPVCAPISWGWSMRVAKRHDGDWCIVRQKLFNPTVGHNGLEMPVWEANQLDHVTSV